MNSKCLVFLGVLAFLSAGFLWLLPTHSVSTVELTSMWSFIGLLAGWTGAVVGSQEKRIRKLEEELAERKAGSG